MSGMRALTIRQPWLNEIARGDKRFPVPVDVKSAVRAQLEART